MTTRCSSAGEVRIASFGTLSTQTPPRRGLLRAVALEERLRKRDSHGRASSLCASASPPGASRAPPNRPPHRRPTIRASRPPPSKSQIRSDAARSALSSSISASISASYLGRWIRRRGTSWAALSPSKAAISPTSRSGASPGRVRRRAHNPGLIPIPIAGQTGMMFPLWLVPPPQSETLVSTGPP